MEFSKSMKKKQAQYGQHRKETMHLGDRSNDSKNVNTGKKQSIQETSAYERKIYCRTATT